MASSISLASALFPSPGDPPLPTPQAFAAQVSGSNAPATGADSYLGVALLPGLAQSNALPVGRDPGSNAAALQLGPSGAHGAPQLGHGAQPPGHGGPAPGHGGASSQQLMLGPAAGLSAGTSARPANVPGGGAHVMLPMGSQPRQPGPVQHGTPWSPVSGSLRDQNHVIWGGIEHASQESMESNYSSMHSSTGLTARRIRNKRISTEGITFVDNSSGGTPNCGGDDLALPAMSSSPTGRGGYTFSAQAWTPAVSSSVQQSAPPCPAVRAAPPTAPGSDHLQLQGDSSGEESEENVQEQQQQQQAQQAQQQAWEAQGVDVAALMAQVPRNEDGSLSSIGSIGHFEGSCNTPCAFAQRKRGCVNGANCSFCHLAHKVKRQRQKHKARPRPCKGKRDRYRKHWEELKDQIEENPEEFDPDSVELPASISTYEKLKAKLVTRLKTHKTKVLAEIEEGGGATEQPPNADVGNQGVPSSKFVAPAAEVSVSL